MKKSNLLLALSSLAMLASCGGGTPASSAESVTPEDVNILIWCAEAAQNLTKSQVETFISKFKQEKGWDKNITFEVQAVGEGDAASKMVTDVESGADVYFFAQDQLSRLVTAGALSAVTGSYLDTVKAGNFADAVQASTVGGNVYAFPATSDNGYFLYYDGSKLSENDVKDWETIIQKAEAGSYEVDLNYSSAWYNFGFFYGAGANSIWTTNDNGQFVGLNDTYNSDKGKIAARAMANIVTSGSVVDTSSVGESGAKSIAVVSGTWDYNAAKDKFKENLKCVELPSFTVNGQKYHTGSFKGYKLVGVKPQTTRAKSYVTRELAQYLTSEAGQLERFNNLQWGPSNKNAYASQAVQQAPQIVAINAQNAHAQVQGQFPGDWWALAGAIGTGIQALGKNATDAQLAAVLATYEAGAQALVIKG